MKIRLLSIMSVAVLLLGSCVSEVLPVEGGSVRATMESDQTRTSVTDEGTFTWSAGDQVWLHTTSGSVAGTLSSGAGTASANFSYGSYFGEMTGKAVNPYNSGHSISGDVLNVVMPSSYDLGTELSSTNAAMYGENVNGNIRFNHLAGVMRFKFNNVPAGVNKFVLTLDKKINGTFAADLTEDYPVIEAEEASSDEEKTITLNFDALTEVSNISLYVPLPLGTYNSLSLSLLAGDEEVWTKTGTATNTINRKSLLLMPTVNLSGSIGGDIEGGDSDDNAYIDDSQFNPEMYLRYISNAYYDGYGDAFDYNMYYYSSYIYNNAFALASKVEYKFQLVSVPTSSCYISLIERGDSTYGIYFNSSGLYVQYNFLSWEELGVDPTDVIVMSIEGDTIIINGRSFSFTTIRRGGYIFSGYYYDRDDGVYSKYYPFQDNAKLFYAKGWDAEGNLIYLGGPDIAEGPSGNDEACWKSTYYFNDELSTQYHFAYYTENQVCYPYGFGNLLGSDDFSIPSTDLSANGTANSYIVSQCGNYTISPVKGNSSESVGSIASVEVLWESYGTDETPAIGSLISSVSYEDDKIKFSTPYREGNAVIAAKDAAGTILWSWHIWFTDQPEEQVYYNNAGTMMDRNLGATSATPGEVGALGLLYQWGRKDPFLNSSSINTTSRVGSTITWPSSVESSAVYGTVEYVTAHPTTSVTTIRTTTSIAGGGTSTSSPIQWDWHYPYRDDNFWSADKTIYDPCPAGWRVPDGGVNSVWAIALGSPENTTDYPYDSTNQGMNLSSVLGSGSIWYPSTQFSSGRPQGAYYTVTAYGSDGKVRPLDFDSNGFFVPTYDGRSRADHCSVRCFKEESSSNVPDDPEEPSEPTPSEPSYSVQLKPSTYGWKLSTSVSNPDASLYDGVYESTNQGRDNTKSIMYIDIDGYDEFTIYIRSYAESTYDYVQVSNLDTDISSVKMHTSGNQNSGTSLSSYTEVTFTNIGGGQHRIMVAYKKDSSQSHNDDKGYVLIPKNQNQGSQTPSSTDLSSNGTANSYIVSESGSYSFSPTKGNSSESVGAISSVEVLWESFGTSETPSVGSLISSVSYADGKISFSTPESYREGNAVIAAKDASGTILWSWHIWLTDQPEEQVYYNNAGTMMDRNLGATSATPGDVGALGLLYQWGRKDPFLGSSSIHYDDKEIAKSTTTWPSAVSSNSSNGTISYAIEHPTTFIKNNRNNYDWYYTGSSSTDNTRWQSEKTIYDPCPVGWRVPDGGSNGVWSIALGSSSFFNDNSLYDSTNEGMNFSGKFGSASTIWYPASGYRSYYDGSLDDVGNRGDYWSVSPYSYEAYYLHFGSNGNVYPSSGSYRVYGQAVRCARES